MLVFEILGAIASLITIGKVLFKLYKYIKSKKTAKPD